MKALVYLAVALGLNLTPAVADEPADAWLKDIEWYTKPSGEDMAKHYPRKAASEERGGWAVLSCRIGEDRRLKKCKVAAEAPEGDGFGKASLALVPGFRALKTKDGRPVEGGRVRIPIGWTLEGDHGPPKSYPAGDPSMIVKVAESTVDKRRTFPCPSKSAPDRLCLAVPVTWATRPEIEDLAALIHKAGDGMSILECSIDPAGALEKCKVANSSPGLTNDELLSLAKLFKAEVAPDSKIAVAGERVMLNFDWTVLRKALEVFEAT